MGNSLMNTPDGDNPVTAATPKTSAQPSSGWLSVEQRLPRMRIDRPQFQRGRLAPFELHRSRPPQKGLEMSVQPFRAANRPYPRPFPAHARRIALIGNYPPRRCGIATFTSDLWNALTGSQPNVRYDVYAMSESGSAYAYPPEVTGEIQQNSIEDYVETARRINRSDADVVCVQHEFGIFGGDAGENILTLLDLVHAPVATTLHTVLADPNEDQRRVMMRLARRSAKLIVMADRGRQILQDTYGVSPVKIAVIPHGAPDHPFVESEPFKSEVGFTGRDVLLTFGLLSPNKGIECMIRSLPRIVAHFPEVLYVVLGATHPNLVAREGEAYRETLFALANELGVGENVRFVNEYVDQAKLLQYLAAVDVYVTPYLNEAQITSGTLSYAVGLGKAVVSTPYWHAKELLADERGMLVPFANPVALASACTALLQDASRRETIRTNAYRGGRETIWARAAERYVSLFHRLATTPSPAAAERSAAPPCISLRGIERYTDKRGILQHGRPDRPDPTHGYCLDDNARALILIHRVRGLAPASQLDRLETVYAGFVDRAWNSEIGQFRNFMNHDGAWLEPAGSHDSFGRAFWSLGVSARCAARSDRRRWAVCLAERALEQARQLASPRAKAFVILGLERLIHTKGELAARARSALDVLSEELLSLLHPIGRCEEAWFETCLAYDNARLPEALLRAGVALGNRRMVKAGLRTLHWLCEIQTAPSGWFRPVGSESLGKSPDEILPFDQQPLEAAATIDACAAAIDASGERRWMREARRAFAWYLGENDLGIPVALPEEGLCHDGLTPCGPNLNHGAESMLSFELAIVSMNSLMQRTYPEAQRNGMRAARFAEETLIAEAVL